MFNDHHYDMAQLSFERAGDMQRADWAKAAGLQQAGERLLGSDAKASAPLFRDAAVLYLSLGKGETAAKCYMKIGESKKAGDVYWSSLDFDIAQCSFFIPPLPSPQKIKSKEKKYCPQMGGTVVKSIVLPVRGLSRNTMIV